MAEMFRIKVKNCRALGDYSMALAALLEEERQASEVTSTLEAIALHVGAMTAALQRGADRRLLTPTDCGALAELGNAIQENLLDLAAGSAPSVALHGMPIAQ